MTTPNTRLPRMLTVREVADQLALCEKTIRRLIKGGQIRVHHLGRQIRIAEDDAVSFIAARRR